VARVHTKRIITVMITERTRFPAAATSMDWVLPTAAPPEELAACPARTQRAPLTPDTLTDAAALTAEPARVGEPARVLGDQELEESLRSAATPVRNRDGVVRAAVNLSASAGRTPPAQEFVPPLRETASRISRDLGHPGS
jgi:IclR family pca regulon transcriptional regulator